MTMRSPIGVAAFRITVGLGEVAIFEKQKLNNIMKLISDIQLKLLGQAAILPNPLLVFVFLAAEHFEP